MKMSCITCRSEVNLDHVIFFNYEGHIKCFSCGTVMQVRTVQGLVEKVAVLKGSAVHTGNIGPMSQSPA